MTSSTVIALDSVSKRLAVELPHWRVREGYLVRVVRTGGWKATLMVVGAVGHLAEAAWHHPDIKASWDRVKIKLQTHDAGGITERDFALARRIEEFVFWRPGPGEGGLEGTPDSDPRFTYVRRDG